MHRSTDSIPFAGDWRKVILPMLYLLDSANLEHIATLIDCYPIVGGDDQSLDHSP